MFEKMIPPGVKYARNLTLRCQKANRDEPKFTTKMAGKRIELVIFEHAWRKTEVVNVRCFSWCCNLMPSSLTGQCKSCTM